MVRTRFLGVLGSFGRPKALPPPPPPPPPVAGLANTALALRLAGTVIAICGALFFLAVALMPRRRPKLLPPPQRQGALPPQPPKLGFTPSRAPATADVVIIGSGPGALAAGSVLSQRGRSCLLLEANESLGGGLHTWDDKGVPFDTGFHYLGEVQHACSSLRRVLDYCAGGADRLEYAALADCPIEPGVYDQVEFEADGRTMKFSPGEQALRSEYKSHFPGAERAVDVFRDRAIAHGTTFLPIAVWRSLNGGLLKRLTRRFFLGLARAEKGRTGQAYLDAIIRTSNPMLQHMANRHELEGALTYLAAGCCGVGPEEGAAVAMLMPTNHFVQGGCYPVGGPSMYVAEAVRVIESAGGAAFVRAPVGAILLDEQGRVCGVRVKDHDIACRTVVSAVGIHLTLQSLLPCPAPSKLPKYAKLAALQHKLEQSGLERTRGHVSLFVTLNGSADELRLPRHNSWIFPGYDLGAQARKLEALNPSTLDAAALKALNAPWMYLALAFPSAKDPAWGGADSHLKDVSTAVVIAEVPTEWWDVWASTRVHARGAAYDDLKLALEAKMLAVLLRRFPQCEGRVRSVSSGTPLSTKQYLHKANGESYGLKPTPALSKCQDDWLQPGLGGAVDGLFLAGQDVNLDGFAGATLGGIMAAAAVDGMGVWLDVLCRAVGVKNMWNELVHGGADFSDAYRHLWQPRADATRAARNPEEGTDGSSDEDDGAGVDHSSVI